MTSPLPFDSELAAVWPRLRRFAHALARDAADADDLAQMSAEKAFKSFDQFQAGTRFDSWIFRICRTVWIDTIRSRSRRGAREAPPEAADGMGHDPTSATEAVIDLGKAMAAMDGRYSVSLDDIRKVAAPVLRHRISTNFQAQAEGQTTDSIIQRLIAEIREPEVPKYDRRGGAA